MTRLAKRGMTGRLKRTRLRPVDLFCRGGFFLLHSGPHRVGFARQPTNQPMIKIIKPLPNHKGDARLSKHRAVLIIAKELSYYLVEEIKTGLVYPASLKHLMPMAKATKAQLAELA